MYWFLHFLKQNEGYILSELSLFIVPKTQNTKFVAVSLCLELKKGGMWLYTYVTKIKISHEVKQMHKECTEK